MTTQQKIQKLLINSILFTDEQKQAWLNLVPKMNDDELKELHGILADEVRELNKEGIKLIEDPKLESELIASDDGIPHGADLQSLRAATLPISAETKFAQELKKEVMTKELPKPTPEPILPKTTFPKPMNPVAPKLPPFPKQFVNPIPAKMPNPPAPSRPLALANLTEMRTIEDLKKIDVGNLRQGMLTDQINIIYSKILAIAKSNRTIPYHIVAAFEQSPLYKTYLAIGAAMIQDQNPDRKAAYEHAVAGSLSRNITALTLKEFEAMADLRRKLEQL